MYKNKADDTLIPPAFHVFLCSALKIVLFSVVYPFINYFVTLPRIDTLPIKIDEYFF